MLSHTSLEAWKVARRVSCGCFLLARDHWNPWAAALFSQLQHAALSVQLNIAEGWSFNRSPTHTRHLGMAYGSSVETGELLGIALTVKAVPAEALAELIGDNHRSQRLLVGLLKRVRPM
jgi:four helix bundle protein